MACVHMSNMSYVCAGSFVLCRVFVRSRGNRLSYNGVSSCAEESACTVRHIGIQHDGFHTPNIVETEVHGDNSAHRKNEMLNFPMRLDCEINDRVKNGPVSISRLQPNVQVPSSVLGGINPIFLDDLATEHLLSIVEGDFIELDDLND
ncbi:NAC domain-containing protein 104-like isoform X1 [Prunus yedoensis var. nudiflora]|uniref:NAC domain-containing protein 104-like isoform X1 n=1 Tax=Prunus yedoensis var. nudiflora TaxID=2094558 RepID=A0A314Z2X1_PRUYE|nr:NAC domain-containing protein 104-like isoform X1 [Prunus yedoensis var. nudiflora]